MYFLAINRIKKEADAAEIGRVIPQHIQWIHEQIAASKIAQAGKWGESGGMSIIRASDLPEARNLLNDDPLVRAGLITFEIAPFYPAVSLSGETA